MRPSTPPTAYRTLTREHLGSVVTLMKLSTDWDDFKAKLDRLHPKTEGDQTLLSIDIPRPKVITPEEKSD